jgi:hypothetical protein
MRGPGFALDNKYALGFICCHPMLMVKTKFAYNEASFFLIRLLQRFSSVSMAMDAQPPDSLAQKEWAGKKGPQGRDRISLASHLTMYVKGGLWVRMDEAGESEI